MKVGISISGTSVDPAGGAWLTRGVARGVGGDDLTLGETTQINDIIHDAVGDDAEIIFGAGSDAAMHGEIRVTVIATGFDRAVTGDQPLTRASGAAGVLNFPQRSGRSSVPGMATPVPPTAQPSPPTPRAAPRVSQAPPAGSTEVPEMEIPTFIRRQMD